MAGRAYVAKDEHAFRRMGRELAEGSVPSFVLLFGREQFLVKWALDAIASKYIPPELAAVDFVRLDAAETDAATVISHCETLPMGGGAKLVALDSEGLLSGEGGRIAERFGEDALMGYMGSVPPGCILAMTARAADKRKRLYKAAVKAGGVYEFSALDPGDLRAFVEKRLRNEGKKARPSVIREFIDMTGYFDRDSEYSLYSVENDIKKLAAYCDGDEIGSADVAAVMSSGLSQNVFALSDAVGRGDSGEAFRLLGELMASGESVYKLLGLLFSQFDLMLSLRELMDSGMTMGEIAARMDVNEYRLKIAAGQAGRFSRDRLRAVLRRACEADRNIKEGILKDGMALEMFLSAALE
ncbi:MAG: DNA polymerase III subunit delta [Clostridiales Family XIII bacterium]|jgi:DNA polymerase-3 subunit delta|nr:DNA polymerase III subunit delta [Clostridiales Family XIII bacterium]